MLASSRTISLVIALIVSLYFQPLPFANAWDQPAIPNQLYSQTVNSCNFNTMPSVTPLNDLSMKLAYGKTFGTSTELDYATMELSKNVRSFPTETMWGPAIGQVQMSFLASYVVYYEGDVEKVKKLDFRDGFELGCLPKGKFTFPGYFVGMVPFLESGAGLSYVSETYRNSGSRWNWSFIGGMGIEKCMSPGSVFCIGVQWRHLSNGNMWGKGDELHNSNSGTDMVQGLASFNQKF